MTRYRLDPADVLLGLPQGDHQGLSVDPIDEVVEASEAWEIERRRWELLPGDPCHLVQLLGRLMDGLNPCEHVDVKVTEPIRRLFRRAISEGTVREDIPPDVLLDLFSGLIKGALDATAGGRRGIEETAAAVTTLFLGGARAP